MSNDLTTTSGSGFLANIDDAYSLLADAASEMGGGSGGVYLKFDGNNGIFTYGATGDELLLGTQVAFNPMSLERGYICWKDEEVVDERMVPFLTGRPPEKSSLPDHGPYEDKQDGWQEQSIVNFKMVDAPYHDLVFKATGVGKRNAVARLVQDFTKAYKANAGLVPIVEVDEVSYESKAKGARNATKHAPVFKIVAWVPESALLIAEDGDAGDYEAPQLQAPAEEPAAEPEAQVEAAPARAQRVRPAPAAPEPEAPTPTRQTAARRGRF